MPDMKANTAMPLRLMVSATPMAPTNMSAMLTSSAY